jgi:hypothetical protein
MVDRSFSMCGLFHSMRNGKQMDVAQQNEESPADRTYPVSRDTIAAFWAASELALRDGLPSGVVCEIIKKLMEELALGDRKLPSNFKLQWKQGNL